MQSPSEQSLIMVKKLCHQRLNRKITISQLYPTNAEISSLSSRSTLNNGTTTTTCRLSNTNRSRISLGLALSLKLILISLCIGIVDVVQSLEPSITITTSGIQLDCIGYNYRQFTIVDHICAECHNLFLAENLHMLCRRNCFVSSYFDNCLDALHIGDIKREKLKQHILDLNGAIFLKIFNNSTETS